MDIKSPEDRSKNMAAVRSRGTQPEVKLRRALWNLGVRFFTHEGWYRLSHKKLPGSPDLIIPSKRLVVFVDGCFWHGCPDHYQEPGSRREFWSHKYSENRERDARVNQALQDLGWQVVRIWEHDVRTRTLPVTLQRILGHLGNPSQEPDP